MHTGQPQRRFNGVSARLLLTLFAIFLILILAQAGINSRRATQALVQEETQALTELNTYYHNELLIRQQAAATLALSFAARADLRDLYLAGDREGVLALLTPLFETLKTEYDIVHLYIENLDGTVFVRVHNPERFGDDITYRRTAVASLETAQTVTGVEIGPNRLGIRSITPLYAGEEMVGLVEVGLDYDQPFIDSLKARYGADFRMWVTQEAAAPAGLQPPESALTPPLPELFYYAGTYPTTFPIPATTYQRVLTSGTAETLLVSVNGEALSVLVAPLLAYGDRTIGIFEIAISRQADLAALRNNLIISAATTGIISLIGFALLAVIINSFVLRPLNHLHTIAQEWRNGNLAARVTHLSQDEFGLLGQTYNTVATQLDTTQKQQAQTIQERTRDLEIVLEVSRNVNQMRDLDELLHSAVHLIQTRFALSTIQIYLLDEATQTLLLRATTAATREQLLDTPQRLLIDNLSRIGTAVIQKQPIVDTTTTNTPPTPTHSQMSIPLLIGSRVVGILDLQSPVPSPVPPPATPLLSHTNLSPFIALAQQLAIAIENARLFTTTQQAQETIAYQAAVEHLRSTISTEFINTPAEATDQAIQYALQQIGEFANVDRAYLFQFSATGTEMSNTHEWCATGITPHRHNLQHLPTADFAYLMQFIGQNRLFYVPTVAEMPATATVEKAEFLAEGIQSIICVPLSRRAQVIGFIGFDAVRQPRQWPDADINLLQLVSAILVGALERQQASQSLAQRAADLQVVAEVSTTISSSLNVSQQLQNVVDLTQEKFGLYHAHIYLLDSSGTDLVLSAGSGTVGRNMVAAGRRIPLRQTQSLVARAARTRQAVIVNYVQADPGFLPNPWLPETQAEMAVPLLIGDQLLGVLDVQATTLGRFTAAAVHIYTTLGTQVAIALQNARIFTQMEQQQHLLTREQSLLNSLLNSAPDLICYKDLVGVYLGCNAAFAAFVGRLTAEIIGHTDFDLFPPEVTALFREQDTQILAQQTARINEEWVDYPDGRRVLLQTLKTPFYGPQQELLGLIGISRDITDRYQFEAALQASESRFRDIALSSGDWVWEVDANGVYTYCSDRVQDVLGYSVLEMIGKTPFDFMAAGERERIGPIFTAAIATRAPLVDLENENVTKDGRSIVLNTSGVPIVGPDGSLLGYRGVDRDITERKQAEESQRRLTAVLDNERRTLQAIFQSLPAGILVVEAAAAARPLLANEQATQLLGRGLSPDAHPDELSQVYPTYIYGTDELYPEESRPLTRAMAGEKSTVDNVEIRRPDGQRTLLEITGAPIYGPNGQVTAAIIVLQNITERKQAEEARTHLNRELAERLEQVDALQRAMTHQGWQAFLTAAERPLHGFIFRQDTLHPVHTTLAESIPGTLHNLSEITEKTLHPNKAMIALPLQLRGESIGILGARSISGEALNDEQQILLSALTTQVAEALDRARLFEETELGRRRLDAQARELAVINEVAQSVSQLLEPADLLETIFKQVKRTLVADAFIVATYNAHQKTLTYPLVYDEGQRFYPRPAHPTADNPWMQVVQTGQPRLLNRTPAEVADRLADLSSTPEQRLGQPGKVSASLIFVPLFLGQRTIGAMSVQSYAHTAYNMRDLALLTGIANHVAVALENARLYAETQRRAEREALVNAITQKIQSTLTVETALETAVTELTRIFQAPYATVEITLSGQQNGQSDPTNQRSNE